MFSKFLKRTQPKPNIFNFESNSNYCSKRANRINTINNQEKMEITKNKINQLR